MSIFKVQVTVETRRKAVASRATVLIVQLTRKFRRTDSAQWINRRRFVRDGTGDIVTGDIPTYLSYTGWPCPIAGSGALMSAYYPSIWQIRKKLRRANSAHKSAD